MFILKKGHQPGVYVPLRALFLVFLWRNRQNYTISIMIQAPDVSEGVGRISSSGKILRVKLTP